MSAPTSSVDVCNLALDHLRQEPVTNIDTPTTKPATICARWYDTTRRALLRKHPWHFAKSRKVLNRNAVTPLFGWADAYNLPTDYLRLLYFGDDSQRNYKNLTLNYEIEASQILIDNSGTATLNLGYIKDVIVVSQFDALFVEVLAGELAVNMAYKFTLKNTVRRELNDFMRDKRLEAKAINGQERPPIRVERSRFAEARKRLTTSVAGKNTIFNA